MRREKKEKKEKAPCPRQCGAGGPAPRWKCCCTAWRRTGGCAPPPRDPGPWSHRSPWRDGAPVFCHVTPQAHDCKGVAAKSEEEEKRKEGAYRQVSLEGELFVGRQDALHEPAFGKAREGRISKKRNTNKDEQRARTSFPGQGRRPGGWHARPCTAVPADESVAGQPGGRTSVHTQQRAGEVIFSSLSLPSSFRHPFVFLFLFASLHLSSSLSFSHILISLPPNSHSQCKRKKRGK